MKRNICKIDAEGKILGRLASEISLILRGKNKPDFAPNVDSGDIVEVSNVDKIKVTGKKLVQKSYFNFSGYPGGIKGTSLRDKISQNPKFVLRHAVYLMLPKNKLRNEIIKKLKFV